MYVDDKWQSKAIFVLLCATPPAVTLVYGGVDLLVLSFLAIVMAVLVVLWLALGWSIGHLPVHTSTLQIPIIALIGMGLVQLLPLGNAATAPGTLNVAASHALTLDQFATRMFVVRLIVYLVFFAAAMTFVDTVSRRRKMAVTFIVFGSLIAFFGILQFLTKPDGIYGIRPTPMAIPFGPFVNQHHFAAFMVMMVGLAMGLLLGPSTKRDRKPFLIIAAVLMVAAIAFTGSRGGVISLGGVVIFAIVGTNKFNRTSATSGNGSRTRKRVLIAAGLTAGLFAVVGMVFYLGGGGSLLRGVGVQESYSDITSGRLHYWAVALKVVLANPVLGSGLDSFGVAYTQYDTLSGLFRVEQAHNDYLQILSDAGIVGLVCVLAFVVLLFRNGLRCIAGISEPFTRSLSIGALAGCLGIAIHSFVDFPLRTPSNALFFLVLAALATTLPRDIE